MRHEEQHIFLMHPFRQEKLHLQQLLDGAEFHERLFHLCAELEANNFISGYVDVADQTVAEDFVDTTVIKAGISRSIISSSIATMERE